MNDELEFTIAQTLWEFDRSSRRIWLEHRRKYLARAALFSEMRSHLADWSLVEDGTIMLEVWDIKRRQLIDRAKAAGFSPIPF